jgi:site-specific recombinase XerD
MSTPPEVEEPYTAPMAKPMVEELFEKFIRDKKYLKNLSERTISSYREVFGRWVRFVGKEMPERERLEKFVMGMRETGFTITTCNISIRSFNSFLSWLHENGHTGERFKIKQIPGGRKILKTFSDSNLRRLLDWRPDPKRRNEVRLSVLLHLLTDTGVRIDEALRLRVDGVDLENLVVKVRGKGDRERIIPISVEMMKGCRKLGIDMGGVDGCFHAFRRKFARNYVRRGGNVIYLQQVMGHSSLQTTRGYVTASEEDLKETHRRTGLLGRLSRREKG